MADLPRRRVLDRRLDPGQLGHLSATEVIVCGGRVAEVEGAGALSVDQQPQCPTAPAM